MCRPQLMQDVGLGDHNTRLVLSVIMGITTIQDKDNRMAMEMPAPVRDSEVAVDQCQLEMVEMSLNLLEEGEEVEVTPEAWAEVELLVEEKPVEEEAEGMVGFYMPQMNTLGECMQLWQKLGKRSGTDTGQVICAMKWIAIWTDAPYPMQLTRW